MGISNKIFLSIFQKYNNRTSSALIMGNLETDKVLGKVLDEERIHCFATDKYLKQFGNK